MAVSQRLLDMLKSRFGGMPELQAELQAKLEGPESIGTDELVDLAVTEGKIGPLAVTEGKLGAGAVTNSKLGAASVTQDKLDQTILRYVDVTISSAEMLAIFTTPKTLVAAPGAGLVIAMDSIYATIDYNSATYAVPNGESLEIKYSAGGTTGAGIQETFLESAADARTFLRFSDMANAPVNTAIVAQMTGGNPTTGDSDVKLRVYYRILPSLL